MVQVSHGSCVHEFGGKPAEVKPGSECFAVLSRYADEYTDVPLTSQPEAKPDKEPV